MVNLKLYLEVRPAGMCVFLTYYFGHQQVGVVLVNVIGKLSLIQCVIVF